MTPKDLIASGLLELYVSGTLNDSDCRLVSQAAAAFPEVQQEIDAIQNSFIAALENEQLVPSAKVELQIFASLNLKNNNSATENKVRSLPRNSFWQWSAAAMLLVLIGAGLVISNLVNQKNNLSAQKQELEIDANAMKSKADFLQQSVTKATADLQVYRSHDYVKVMMTEVAGLSHRAACVYWNPITHKLYVDNCGLSNPGEKKVYQLWAMKDGKPIDAGVFDKNNFHAGLQEFKDIDAAQAFAVTIENEGGASVPTLSTMQVIGKI